jgi:uncharacterized protein
MSKEQRSLMRAPELRAIGASTGSPGTVAGYAAVFNAEADIGGYWREVIAPGAFTQTLRDDDVLAYSAHDSARILGRTSSGTLRLREDGTGLGVEIDLPDTTDGRDVAELVRRGDLKGMSFGFIVTKEQWDETVDPPLRTIQQVELIEVSAVGRPAYGDTSLGLRSLEKARGDRDAGQAERNRHEAEQRIAARKADMNNRFRGIRPKDSRA